MLSIFDLLKDEIATEKDNNVENSTGKEKRKSGKVAKSRGGTSGKIITDHIPSKPGVYFWKDAQGNFLYIGKAKKLRSRVKSYLSPGTKHTMRIKNSIG